MIYSKLNIYHIFSGIEFPVSAPDITKLEKLNNIRINVFRLSSAKNVMPWRISNELFDDTINLLELINGSNHHYVYVKKLGNLVSNYSENTKRTRYVCERCLYTTLYKTVYEDHIDMCKHHRIQKTYCPKEEKATLSYTKTDACKVTRYEAESAFVCFADFECALKPTNDDDIVLNQHQPISAVYKIISPIDKSFYTPPKTFLGLNCVVEFLDSLQSDVAKIRHILRERAPLNPSTAEQTELDNQTSCHLCKETFKPTDEIVIDHCHITSVIRGRAHRSCNLEYRLDVENFNLTVYFHNLTG